MLLTVLYGSLAIFAAYHVQWHTRPDLYPSFAGDADDGELIGLLMGGMFLLVPVTFALLLILRRSFYGLSSEILNLNDITTNGDKKMWIEVFRFVGAGLIPVGLLIFLIIG